MSDAGTRWIAEDSVFFVSPNGLRIVGKIAIGEPYKTGDGAICTVLIEGLHSPLAVSGISTLQALILAVEFIAARLKSFYEQGGKIMNIDGEEVPFSAFFQRGFVL